METSVGPRRHVAAKLLALLLAEATASFSETARLRADIERVCVCTKYTKGPFLAIAVAPLLLRYRSLLGVADAVDDLPRTAIACDSGDGDRAENDDLADKSEVGNRTLNSSRMDEVPSLVISHCRDIASRWLKDEWVDSVTQVRHCLVFKLNKAALIEHAVRMVSVHGTSYSGLLLRSQMQTHQPIIVEYDLPSFGAPFEGWHLRGLLLAQFVTRTLRLAGCDAVSTRCHIRLWDISSGVVMSAYENLSATERQSISQSLSDPSKTLSCLEALLAQRTKQSTVSSRRFLRRLHVGEPSALAVFKSIFGSWAKAMEEVLIRYGARDLNVQTDELMYGGVDCVKALVIDPLRFGHDDAPIRADGVDGHEFEDDGDDDDDDIDGDKDENESKFGEDNGENSMRGESAITLEVRIDAGLCAARISHHLGAPTELAVDVATHLRRGASTVKTYRVAPWQIQHHLTLTKIVSKLVTATSSSTGMSIIPFGHVTGLDSEFTSVEERSSRDPFRWVDLARTHLRGISGKSTMVFRRDDDDDDVADKPLDDSTPTHLATSTISVQISQHRRSKPLTFDWSLIVERKRDVGTYLQYSHARLCGIQRRSGVVPKVENVGALLANTPAAVELAAAIDHFPAALLLASDDWDLSSFIPQLTSLARLISSGHNSMFVKGSDSKLAAARMALLQSARVVVGSSLELLGLVALERM